MSLNETFAAGLRFWRERARMTQEALADRSGLDRTYVSQLERGLKSPTLTTIDSLARAMAISPRRLISPSPRFPAPRIASDYVIRDAESLAVRRGRECIHVRLQPFLRAVDLMHDLLDDLYAADLDVASLLGMRNLSAFVGEVMAKAAVSAFEGVFVRNPHQDGYPDLLLMDEVGKKTWSTLTERRGEKSPFSPFPGGGIEVKATCGAVPPPAFCRRRGLIRPEIGDQRISVLSGYDWKAHHRDTNNLLGLLWDFIDHRPRIVALFYSADLTERDWGRIVKPRDGGGRTTSVSIIERSGRRKMYEGWICALRTGGYIEFLNRRNKGESIPLSEP